MPTLNSKQVIRACRLSFQGNTDEDIANELKVHAATISRWRQLPLWQQTHSKLIEITIDEESGKFLQGKNEKRRDHINTDTPGP